MILSPLTSPWVAFALGVISLLHFVSPTERSPWPRPSGPKELDDVYGSIRPSFVYKVSFILLGVGHLILWGAISLWDIPSVYQVAIRKGMTFLYGAPLFYLLGWLYLPERVRSGDQQTTVDGSRVKTAPSGHLRKTLLKFSLLGGVVFLTVARLHSSFLLELVHSCLILLLGLLLVFYRRALLEGAKRLFFGLLLLLGVSLGVTFIELGFFPIPQLPLLGSLGEVSFCLAGLMLLRWIKWLERLME